MLLIGYQSEIMRTFEETSYVEGRGCLMSIRINGYEMIPFGNQRWQCKITHLVRDFPASHVWWLEGIDGKNSYSWLQLYDDLPFGPVLCHAAMPVLDPEHEISLFSKPQMVLNSWWHWIFHDPIGFIEISTDPSLRRAKTSCCDAVT